MVILHGGSRCAERHAHDLAKANGIRPEYAGMHMSLRFHCKNDIWTDARAKMIYEETQRLLVEECAPLPGTLEKRIMTAEREQEIYMEVAEVNPKGCVLGQGCLSQLYVGSKSRGDNNSYLSPVDAHIRDLEARLKEKEEEEVRYKEEQARKDVARDEKMKEMKDQISHFTYFLKQFGPAFTSFSSSSQ